MEDNINGVILEEAKKTLPEEIDPNILDKDIFFDSKEAKKKTTTVKKKILEVQMLPVYQAITGAINQGLNYVEVSVLNESQLSFLRKKGFSIYYGHNNAFTKITW